MRSLEPGAWCLCGSQRALGAHLGFLSCQPPTTLSAAGGDLPRPLVALFVARISSLSSQISGWWTVGPHETEPGGQQWTWPSLVPAPAAASADAASADRPCCGFSGQPALGAPSPATSCSGLEAAPLGVSCGLFRVLEWSFWMCSLHARSPPPGGIFNLGFPWVLSVWAVFAGILPHLSHCSAFLPSLH